LQRTTCLFVRVVGLAGSFASQHFVGGEAFEGESCP
jgi:hypothetical protein